MKTLFNFTLQTLKRIGLPTAAFLLLTSPLLTAAQSANHFFAEGDPAADSLHQRIQRRMADVSQRLDSLTDYLADLRPGDDGFVWLAPDFPSLPSIDFFDQPDMDELDRIDPGTYFPMMPPMPDFHFDFPPDFPSDWYEGDDNFNFFWKSPGEGGISICDDPRDSLNRKPGQKGRNFVVICQGDDTIMLGGNHGMVYSIADSNGYFTAKTYKLAGDSLFADTAGGYFYAYSDDAGQPGKQFNWHMDRKKGYFSEPKHVSRGYYLTNPGNARSAALTDLTPHDISNLKKSDLKPSRKVIPLGIDDLRINPLRDSHQLRLRFGVQGDSDLTVQLFDQDGAMFHDESLRKSNGSYDNRITLPDHASDELYIRISQGKQSLIKKIVW